MMIWGKAAESGRAHWRDNVEMADRAAWGASAEARSYGQGRFAAGALAAAALAFHEVQQLGQEIPDNRQIPLHQSLQQPHHQRAQKRKPNRRP